MMAPLIRSCLAATADESRHLIVVSDANGVLLWVEGNAAVRMRAADSMNFAEGTLWSEGGAGTNAIGTALAAEHAVQVFATEHFNEVVQAWTCAAAPVYDPDTGQVIGVIDLTGEMATVHPHSMAVATATAQAVEAQLRCEMLDRDARLLARYGDQLHAGSGPARAGRAERARDRQPAARLAARRTAEGPAGRGPGAARRRPRAGRRGARSRGRLPGPLRGRAGPRGDKRAPALQLTLLGREPPTPSCRAAGADCGCATAEILTLLCANPDGLTSEELSAGVYGTADAGGRDPGRDLAPAQAARRLHRDRALPSARRASRATSPRCAACCTAAMCVKPRPVTPARCCRARPPRAWSRARGARGWMRQSVMSAGDVEALWAWLQTVAAHRDLPAWQRLLSNLAFPGPAPEPRGVPDSAQLRMTETPPAATALTAV